MPLQTRLRYLFTAVFDDQTTFLQKEDDTSDLDPKRSSFYDLLERVKSGKKIALFHLVGPEKVVSVNLMNGEFWFGNAIFRAEPSSAPLPEGGEYELVYFRDHLATLNVGTGEQSDTHRYRIGWVYKLGDKTWTQCITFE